MFLKRIELLLIVVLALGFTGCAVLPSLTVEGDNPESPAQDGEGRFIVEKHPWLGKPELYHGVISKPITIQEALNESGAGNMARSAEVDLIRRLPDGGVLKLPVEFNKDKQVKFEQDYALHPGDRIVVRAKSESPLDKLVDQVFGEL